MIMNYRVCKALQLLLIDNDLAVCLKVILYVISVSRLANTFS